MTLEQFNKLYKQTEDNLRANFELDKLKFERGLPVRRDSLENVRTTFSFDKDDKDSIEKIKNLNEFLSSVNNPSVDSYPRTKTVYGGYEFIGFEYLVTHKKLKENMDEKAIKAKMKSIVGNILRKSTKYWTTPDCAIMELFKQGKISWDDVVLAHTIDCH